MSQWSRVAFAATVLATVILIAVVGSVIERVAR